MAHGAAAALSALAAIGAWSFVVRHAGELGWFPGSDVRFLLEATRRWTEGGGFYEAHALAGPFTIAFSDYEVLWPPTALLLFLPFLVLPLALWWLVPLAVTGWIVWSWRPSAFAWSGIFLALAFPNTVALLVAGNPVMWGVMALALATRYGWPAALLILKPTVFPLALLWVRRRSWLVALAGVGLVSLAFLPMWPDYLTVIANARNPLGPLYSVGNVPLLLIPVVAWLGRARL